MASMVIPGIYVQEQQYNLNPLQIDSRCLTGFAGITESGPVNTPVKINSFDEYLKLFGGFDTAGVLPSAVYSFFRCGGKECVVVRVADEKSASCSNLKIKQKGGNIVFSVKTPGHWGNNVSSNVWKEDEEFFSVSFSYNGKTESYLHLTVDPADERYFEKYINDHSDKYRVSHEGTIKNPEPFIMKMFSGGKDGIAALSAGNYIGFYNGLGEYAGIGCFEAYDDIALIAAPDLCWFKKKEDVFAVQKALIDQAERFSNRFAVLDVPKGLSVIEAMEWAKKLSTFYAACYYPFVDVTDPLDKTGINTIRIPPSGGVCGCIASTDGNKGIFHAPANCLYDGAVGISDSITSGEQEVLYSAGINILRYFPGRGVKIWGARTLSPEKEWQQINVRRTFDRVCKSLKEGTQWAVFETNNKNLRKRLVRQVTGFLLNLWRDGYFAGSTAEQGFYVRCDEELNPPENIDNGILTFEVGLAIVRPAEFFKITLTAEKDGASVYLQD